MQQKEEASRLREARFTGDRAGEEVVRADPELSLMIERAVGAAAGSSVRGHFLSTAVRVNPKVLPGLAQAFEHIRARTGVELPMEAYVYAEPQVNAFVVRGSERVFVVLSSGAVERLSPAELDFVIGHELGHAYYGHLDLPVNAVLNRTRDIKARQAMQLLGWQRKAEISADRAGLLCCGSLDTAATALFKTLSGLAIKDLAIDPQEFADQWNDLSQEVQSHGQGDHWMSTHPFPPLRMKALIAFWNSDHAGRLIDEAEGTNLLARTDEEIESLLAMMDPLARERSDAVDPILGRFFLWGGLYIATADQRLDERELENLRSVLGTSTVNDALGEGGLSPALLRERFRQARDERRSPLSALELHRIFSGLATVAAADGNIDQSENIALRDLAGVCGVNESFIDVVLAKAA
jgi:uncharacterized tellurite resistance protein B-like protein